jgi:hypothetical protein
MGPLPLGVSMMLNEAGPPGQPGELPIWIVYTEPAVTGIVTSLC